jgi:hypothetical protein
MLADQTAPTPEAAAPPEPDKKPAAKLKPKPRFTGKRTKPKKNRGTEEARDHVQGKASRRIARRTAADRRHQVDGRREPGARGLGPARARRERLIVRTSSRLPLRRRGAIRFDISGVEAAPNQLSDSFRQ